MKETFEKTTRKRPKKLVKSPNPSNIAEQGYSNAPWTLTGIIGGGTVGAAVGGRLGAIIGALVCGGIGAARDQAEEEKLRR